MRRGEVVFEYVLGIICEAPARMKVHVVSRCCVGREFRFILNKESWMEDKGKLCEKNMRENIVGDG